MFFSECRSHGSLFTWFKVRNATVKNFVEIKALSSKKIDAGTLARKYSVERLEIR